MAPTILATNDQPTPMEKARLSRIAQSLQSDMDNTMRRIEEEKVENDTSFKAIKNLQDGITRIGDLIKANAKYKDILMCAKESIPKAITSSLCGEDEPYSIKLCDSVQLCAVEQIERRYTLMEAEILMVEEEERTLAGKVRTMEEEKQGWKNSFEISHDTLKDLKAYQKTISKNLKSAKATLSSIRNVPQETWAQIFLLTVKFEYFDYFQCGGVEIAPRPTALVLSQVSKFWRRIIQNEPSLWNIIAVHAKQYWPQSEYTHFCELIRKARPLITLVSNLSEGVRWYGGPFSRKGMLDAGKDEEDEGDSKSAVTGDTSRAGRMITLTPPRADSMSGKEYELHLHMTTDQHSHIQTASYIPFQTPTDLLLTSQSPFSNPHLFRLLPEFPTTVRLTMRNLSPRLLPSEGLFSVMPRLTILNLMVGELPPDFSLESFCSPLLEILHIRHNGRGTMRELDSVVELPNLRWLGITASHANFFTNLRLPALSGLTLHGPKSLTDTSMPSGDSADEIYGQIHYLYFHEWEKPTTLDELGAVAELIKLEKKLTLLGSLEFSNSFVDGQALLSMLDTQGSEEDIPVGLQLSELNLSENTGVTRDDCDRLATLVAKLNLYADPQSAEGYSSTNIQRIEA